MNNAVVVSIFVGSSKRLHFRIKWQVSGEVDISLFSTLSCPATSAYQKDDNGDELPVDGT